MCTGASNDAGRRKKMKILCINPGSATLKYTRFDIRGESNVTCEERETTRYSCERHFSELLREILSRNREASSLGAIAVRVVHGGSYFTQPTRVTDEVCARVAALCPLAPLHNPLALLTLQICKEQCGDLPTFAVFDTTFHTTIPDEARRYALPYQLCESLGIYRYGFHGIAHHGNYVALSQLQEVRRKARVISCHLGSGMSICAILHGKSIDTTMGFTPLAGIPMGTRCGDIDPGITLFLQREHGMNVGEIENVLNHQSGLLGLSETSADVQELERLGDLGDLRAQEALKLVTYRIATMIGAYHVALGGLDVIAFSGGIGQHSAKMRTAICQRVRHLGIKLDDERNSRAMTQDETPIHDRGSSVAVVVVRSDEERLMALDVLEQEGLEFGVLERRPPGRHYPPRQSMQRE